MGWVITKARGNERVREQKKRKREQERHNGRGRQESLGVEPWSTLTFGCLGDLAQFMSSERSSLLEEDKNAPSLLFLQNQMI